MENQNISKPRLILNGFGSLLVVFFCLPICFSPALDLVSVSSLKPTAPDGDKALGIYTLGIGFCGLLGAIALVSLVRTVKRWRALPGK